MPYVSRTAAGKRERLAMLPVFRRKKNNTENSRSCGITDSQLLLPKSFRHI
jgi:hypothetical protein